MENRFGLCCIEEVEMGKLDGCYVLKTDLSVTSMDKDTVHDRYKDLAMVEHAFRTMKTSLLEIRPIYVRKESHKIYKNKVLKY